MKKRTIVIIPVKDLSHTKSRLSRVLTLDQRQALTFCILSRTIQIAKCAGHIDSVLIITPDEDVLAFVKTLGVQGMKEKTKGLNQALLGATYWAIDHDFETVLVLPADIPFVSRKDIESIMMMARREERMVVIAPDTDKIGTNALLVKPPGILKYSFGVNSFQRHRQQALAQNLKVKVYSSVTVAFDLDTAEEYRLLVEKKTCLSESPLA
jgi:2-phospho-L-lactate/phosphoenolpyruvate guanylyltransferase